MFDGVSRDALSRQLEDLFVEVFRDLCHKIPRQPDELVVGFRGGAEGGGREGGGGV